MNAFRMFGPPAALCIAVLASLAAPASGQPADDPTPLTGVTVAAPRRPVLSGVTVALPVKCLPARVPFDPDIPPPKLVSSFPAQGAVVRPGILVLRFTFDLPMSCDGIFQPDPPWRKPCPGTVQHLVISFDRRTIRMACMVEKDAYYGLRLNSLPYLHFRSMAGRSAEPYALAFSTSSQAEITTLEEAQAQDTQMRPDTPLLARDEDDPPATPASAPGPGATGSKRGVLSEVTVAPPARCLEARNPPDPQIPHPKIVSSFPAPGAVVRPGLLVLRVTFDLPMSCGGMFLADAPLRDPCPRQAQDLILSYDRRTIQTVCQLDRNTRYGVRMNRGPGLRFVSLAGWPSDPYELTFSSSSDGEITSLEDALAEDPAAPPATLAQER
jgi:hypothetical protein